MKKKLYIALSVVAVFAVVIVAVASQGNYFKGDFRPLSGPCDKPLSVTGGAKPLSTAGSKPLSNPCGRPAPVQKADRDEKEMNKYIAPNVPVEKLSPVVKTLTPAQQRMAVRQASAAKRLQAIKQAQAK